MGILKCRDPEVVAICDRTTTSIHPSICPRPWTSKDVPTGVMSLSKFPYNRHDIGIVCVGLELQRACRPSGIFVYVNWLKAGDEEGLLYHSRWP